MVASLVLAVAALLSPDWKVEVRDGVVWREVPVRRIPVGAGVGQHAWTNETGVATCDGLNWACPMALAADGTGRIRYSQHRLPQCDS